MFVLICLNTVVWCYVFVLLACCYHRSCCCVCCACLLLLGLRLQFIIARFIYVVSLLSIVVFVAWFTCVGVSVVVVAVVAVFAGVVRLVVVAHCCSFYICVKLCIYCCVVFLVCFTCVLC